jgi:membrane associated rhomboid family serine protease
MAGRRRQGDEFRRILTLGDNVPRSVGGILVAMLVSTVAAMVSRGLWGLLNLDGPAIFSGQVWRLVTWVFPQNDPLTLFFAGFALFWLGRDLANTWSERRFLQVFFGYAAWSALWTALVAAIWAGADRPYVGAWPVVNALMVGWGLSRPGAQINLFGVVPMTGKVFGGVRPALRRDRPGAPDERGRHAAQALASREGAVVQGADEAAHEPPAPCSPRG